MIHLLKQDGRAGIVLPDGSLTGDGVKQRVREKLLRDCNLHTIIRLPNSVFQPYATVATNLLFFDKKVGQSSNPENKGSVQPATVQPHGAAVAIYVLSVQLDATSALSDTSNCFNALSCRSRCLPICAAMAGAAWLCTQTEGNCFSTAPSALPMYCRSAS